MQKMFFNVKNGLRGGPKIRILLALGNLPDDYTELGKTLVFRGAFLKTTSTYA